MTTEKEMLERFMRSPAGRELQAEDDAKTLLAREVLVAEITDLRTSLMAALPALIAVEKDTLAQVEACETALQEARLAHGEAEIARVDLTYSYGNRIGRLERELRATASALIDQTIKILHNELTLIGCSDPNYKESGFHSEGELQRLEDTKLRETDQQSRIQQAITIAKSYRLLALTGPELTEKLNALRRGTYLSASTLPKEDEATYQREHKLWLARKSMY